ncbi:hypothetical protein HDC96_000556 [Stenotrophomonas sp. JAI102]|nr:hypothetical protein [Stenotrophomonas sp. JAI102]
MSIPSQDYAALSDDAYQDRAVGRRAPGQQEPVTLNGHQYKVLEHVNNPSNGYQGTVYQRVDTKEREDVKSLGCNARRTRRPRCGPRWNSSLWSGTADDQRFQPAEQRLGNLMEKQQAPPATDCGQRKDLNSDILHAE